MRLSTGRKESVNTMKMNFRWYGTSNDTITLRDICQIPGTEGVVWALHDIPVGEVWTEDKIKETTDKIAEAGLTFDVVESVNVHEDIKLGRPTRTQYIENYKTTIKNLAKVGVKVICYNFMPVFDWTRTELFKENPDGSTSLFYERAKVDQVDPADFIKKVTDESNGLIMPGWEPERLSHIKSLLEAYKGVSAEDLWQNLAYFLQQIIPVAEECDVQMAIHPDDPPWSIFGLPRIITCKESLQRFLALKDSPSNCLTLCSGSLGASQDNDIPSLIRTFADHIAFMHVRNVKHFENGDFIEASHRSCDGDIDIVDVVTALHENNYTGYIRPDHGRHIWDEQCRPGYGLYDRALGIMYILGIWDKLNY